MSASRKRKAAPARKGAAAAPAKPSDDGRLHVEYWPLAKLAEWPGNPKQHDREGIAGSMRRWGYTDPCMIDETTGRLVRGHGRREVLLELRAAGQAPPEHVKTTEEGEWLVPVLRGVAFANEDEAASYVVADNQLTIVGGWDEKRLAPIFARIMERKLPLLGIGFKQAEVDRIIKRATRTARRQEDPGAQPPPVEPVTRPGDLWLLGDHRLLCGDAHRAEVLAQLMDGKRARICVTSPPYNQGLDGFKPSGMGKDPAWGGFVSRMAGSYSDSLPESEYQAQQVALLDLVAQQLTHDGSVFYNHKVRYRDKEIVHPLDWLRRCATLKVRQEVVWDRGTSMTMNARMFIPADERIYWLRVGEEFVFHDETEIKSWSSVWDVGAKIELRISAPFPNEIPLRCLRAASDEGDIVIEPHSGSGTTLVVADQLHRACYAVEIAPQYVDAAIERWCTMTGGAAVLESSGHDFARVKAERASAPTQ